MPHLELQKWMFIPFSWSVFFSFFFLLTYCFSFFFFSFFLGSYLFCFLFVCSSFFFFLSYWHTLYLWNKSQYNYCTKSKPSWRGQWCFPYPTCGGPVVLVSLKKRRSSSALLSVKSASLSVSQSVCTRVRLSVFQTVRVKVWETATFWFTRNAVQIAFVWS